MSFKYFISDSSREYFCPKCEKAWDYHKNEQFYETIQYKLCPKCEQLIKFKNMNINLEKIDLIDELLEKINKLTERVNELEKKID